jgi:DNA polymerase III subunit delta'
MADKFHWDFIGHDNIKKYLTRTLERGKPAHAYLFIGPEGIGKVQAAEEFVKAFFCHTGESDASAVPCGNCDQCSQLAHKVHPDFFPVVREEGKKNLSIEQIRSLLDKLSLHSFLSKYKLAFIPEAHLLNEEAANALLKTLEEPTEKTILILVADTLETLPDTIVSRCQVIRFYPVIKENLLEYLLSEEVDDVTAKEMVQLAQGRADLVRSWVEDPHEWEVCKDAYAKKIASLKLSLHEHFIQSKKSLSQKKFFNEKLEFAETELNEWLLIFRDIILLKSGNERLVINTRQIKDLEKVAFSYSSERVQAILHYLFSMKHTIKFNPNPDLLMENVYVQLLTT